MTARKLISVLGVAFHILNIRVAAQQTTTAEAIFYATNAANAVESFAQHVKQVDIIAPQSYRIDARGNLTGSVPQLIVEIARRNNVRVMPLIINPDWNLELFSSVVNDSS